MLKQPLLVTISAALCSVLIGCGDGNNAASKTSNSTPPSSVAPPMPAPSGPTTTPAADPAAADAKGSPFGPPATTNANPSNAVVSAAGKPAEFTVTAEQMAKDFIADKAAATAKYVGKTVRVDGKVIKTGDDGAGVSVLKIVGDGEVRILSGVASESRPALAQLKEGQDVSVVAEIYGFKDNEIEMMYGVIIR